MKALLTILVLLIAQQPLFVKGKGFKGYIFSEDVEMYVYFKEKPGRFTPTRAEVILCEKLLKEQLRNIKQSKAAQCAGCLVIHENLQRYMRQYVGYINEKGEKILWINMLWDESSYLEDVDKRIIMVDDGGNYYWNVKVNLKSAKIYDLQINGHG